MTGPGTADTALDGFPPGTASPARDGGAAGGQAAPGGQRERPDWALSGAASPGPASPGPASPGPAGSVGPGRAVTSGAAADDYATANPLATPALAAGILGIAVLPGVILGILGLRRAAVTGTGRVQSWLGIVLSALWAAGLIVLALPGPGAAADPGCVQYRSAGSAAVARVVSALPPRAPTARLRAALGPAADAVNDAAARAQGIGVSDTLAALSGDLQSEQAATLAGRPGPAALATALARAAAAAGHRCGVPG
jgi:hypothetical protein